MGSLPRTEHALVIRADFSDDLAWELLCKAICKPVGEFRAYVEFLDKPVYDGLSSKKLQGFNLDQYGYEFAFIADQVTLGTPDRPILVVDLDEENPGHTFRVIPSEMWAVENNLSISNMDFEEFADNTDADGIFRGSG